MTKACTCEADTQDASEAVEASSVASTALQFAP